VCWDFTTDAKVFLYDGDCAGAGALEVTGVLTAGGGMTMGDDLEIADYDIKNPSQIYREAPTSDVAPTAMDLIGENAYSQATGGSQTGADVNVASGIGTRQVTIDDWNNCATDTVTLTIDGADTVCTEAGGGCTWTAAVDNATTATSLAAGIDAVSGVSASAVAAVVYIIPDDDDTLTVALAEGDATCTSLTQGTDGSVAIHTAHNALVVSPDQVIVGNNGSQQYPAIAWADDNDGTGTGFYRSSANNIRVAVNGSPVMRWLPTYTVLQGNLDAQSNRLYSASGSLRLGADYAVTEGGVTGSAGFGKDAGGISLEVEGTSFFEDSAYLRSEAHFTNNAAAATFGAVGTDADVVLAFDAVTAQGSITYMEDEDRFDFDNDVDVVADLTAGTIASDAQVTGTYGTFALGAAEKFYLNAATTEHTQTAGVLDLDLVPTTAATGVVAADIHITAPADGIEATTHVGLNIQYTGDAQDEGASIVQLIQVGFAPNTSPTTVYGLYSGDNDLDYFIFNDGTAPSRFDGEVVFANNPATATFGLSTTDADVVLTFDALGATQGTITWMEDEDRFDFDNDVTIGGDFVLTDGNITHTVEGTQTVVAGTTITSVNKHNPVAGNGGAIVMTSTPTIAAGSPGDEVCIIGTSDANTVELQDETTIAGSTLELSGDVDMVLGIHDTICFVYYNSHWVETTRSDNDDD
jgi:hypothetical protein